MPSLFTIVGEFWQEGAPDFFLVDVHLQSAQLLHGKAAVLQVGLVPSDADVDPSPVHDYPGHGEVPHLLSGTHHGHEVRTLVIDGEAGVGCSRSGGIS